MDYHLPKKFKVKWIEGLRSEDYPKVNGTLCELTFDESSLLYDRDCKGYCALGVAIAHCTDTPHELYTGDSHWQSSFNLPIDDNYFRGHTELKEAKMLLILQDKVIDLNDRERFSFDEIAEWIENNVEGV